MFSCSVTVSHPIDPQRSRRWKVAFIVSLGGGGAPPRTLLLESGALLFKPPPFSFVRTNYLSCVYYPPRPRVTAKKCNRFPKVPLNTPTPSKRLYSWRRFLVLFPDEGNNETKRMHPFPYHLTRVLLSGEAAADAETRRRKLVV